MNIVRRVLLPVLYRRGGSQQINYYKYMKKAQWNPLADNISIQKKLLYKTLVHAFANIPYYKKMNVAIDQFSEDTIFEDIKSIPFLTKKELIQEVECFSYKMPGINGVYQNITGGSTGETVRLLQDKYYFDWMMGSKILYDEWAGRCMGECRLALWGSERDLFYGKSLFSSLADWVRNENKLNAFKASKTDLEGFIRQINKKKPKMILSYVESAYDLAKFIKSHNLDVYSPDSVMTSAGTLYPEFRKLIEEIFRCPVFDRYGSREAGDMACECERHEGLHLNIFNSYLEVVNKNGEPCKPGEEGEIVLTTLRNFTMPLIRYRIGDLGVYSQKSCSCGRGLPMLEKVIGRTTDVFRNKKGDLIHGLYFTPVFLLRENVVKYQVIQESEECIKVYLVLDNVLPDDFKRENFDDITDKIRLVMGEETKIEFHLVDQIEPSESGKFLYTISKLKQ